MPLCRCQHDFVVERSTGVKGLLFQPISDFCSFESLLLGRQDRHFPLLSVSASGHRVGRQAALDNAGKQLRREFGSPSDIITPPWLWTGERLRIWRFHGVVEAKAFILDIGPEKKLKKIRSPPVSISEG